MDRSFLAVSLLGTLFVATETVLQGFGKSICGGTGCKLVAQYTRFGDLSVLLLGLGMFGLLALLAYFVSVRGRQDLSRFIDLLLIAALAGEGFFTGFQAFRLHAACVFCLIVFGLLVVLALLRLVAGHWEMTAGFSALATVFLLFYLVLPVDSTVSLPAGKQKVLFYSATCRHCSELLKELEERNLQVEHVLVDPYIPVLKSAGIEGVPTLFVNDGSRKLFVTGKGPILDYLLAQTAPARGKRQLAPEPGKNMLNSGGGFEIVVPPSDDGACRQDKDCP